MNNSVIQVFATKRKSFDPKISEREVNKIESNKESPEIDKFNLKWTKGKDIQTLEEAEKYLERLLKQRNTLVGDFYGINRTAYRYVMAFDRLGYIRSRIVKTDRKIKTIKRKITKFKGKAKKKAN
jgi:hypothetical protein